MRKIHQFGIHKLRQDLGQATAEYALVIVGAATVAIMLLTWATNSGSVGSLLDQMLGTISGMVN